MRWLTAGGLLFPGVVLVTAVCLECGLCLLAVLTVVRVMQLSDLERPLAVAMDLVLVLPLSGRGLHLLLG